MNEGKKCLFVGRFQPFHMGHLMVAQGMVKFCETVVIAIGSSNRSNEPDNPFTAEERMEMIQRALQEKDVIPTHDVRFVQIPDMPEDTDWVEAVLEAAGDVGVVWTGNEHTKECFEGSGVEIQDIKEVPGISGTEIRQKMVNGDPSWRDQVAKSVADYLDSIDGESRL